MKLELCGGFWGGLITYIPASHWNGELIDMGIWKTETKMFFVILQLIRKSMA